MEELKIAHVVKAWDMRKKHALREGTRARRLKPGQVLVAFNKALDMARFIDCEGGVHDYYADPGTRYDLVQLADQIRRGIGAELEVGRHEVVHGRLRVAA